MITAITAILILYTIGGNIVKNKNEKTWIKPKNSKVPKYLPYGKSVILIDGVATQKGVFKLHYSACVKIDKEGNIKLTFFSKLLNFLLQLSSGYKEEHFIVKNPDWQELWQKYKEICQN